MGRNVIGLNLLLGLLIALVREMADVEGGSPPRRSFLPLLLVGVVLRLLLGEGLLSTLCVRCAHALRVRLRVTAIGVTRTSVRGIAHHVVLSFAITGRSTGKDRSSVEGSQNEHAKRQKR